MGTHNVKNRATRFDLEEAPQVLSVMTLGGMPLVMVDLYADLAKAHAAKSLRGERLDRYRSIIDRRVQTYRRSIAGGGVVPGPIRGACHTLEYDLDEKTICQICD